MFVNVNPQMSVVREEIFGPVVVAQPFDDMADIARIANDSIYGLAASIWGRTWARFSGSRRSCGRAPSG